MNINIGENLRRLRKNKDITQEELAGILSVSFQAVSKWERGDTFPDITMLPALSNFFEVSVDEIIGMNKIRDRENIQQAHKKINELNSCGNYEEVIEFIKNLLKTYPNQYSFMASLAEVYFLNDENTEEAIRLCKCFLANSMNEKIRSEMRSILCFLYNKNGELQKARNLARTLPHIWESREILQIEFLDGQEYIDALKKTIITTLSIICDKIDSIGHPENMENIIKNILVLGQQANADIINNKQEALTKILDFLN